MSALQQKNHLRIIGRWLAFLTCVSFFVGYGLYTMMLNMGPKEVQTIENYQAIPKECIDEANKIAIQSGGRVKPFITWAKFLTYSMHGSSSLKLKSGEETHKLSSTEIILQCLYRPEFTNKLTLFRIEDKVILSSLSSFFKN